jgi:hypothetical protein
MDELIDAIKNSLKKKDYPEEYIIMNSHYIPKPLSMDNFHFIIPDDTILTGNALTFIDGGQAILYDTPSLAIGFLRIGAITYANLKKKTRLKKEFYVLVSSDKNLIVHTFPKTSFDGMIFNPEDESLKNGLDRCVPSRIISVIRRYAELELALQFDNPVLDGTLDARYPHELEYISRLKNAVAVSKTCSLTLNTGESITKRLYMMKTGVWNYYPVVENKNKNHPAEIYFAKLHQKSKHVFRVESKDNPLIETAFEILVIHSSDPVFYGYPYGLIDVDQYVRVSEEEKGFLRTKLNVKLGKSLNELELEEHSIDAHAILDKVKF